MFEKQSWWKADKQYNLHRRIQLIPAEHSAAKCCEQNRLDVQEESKRENFEKNVGLVV